MLSIMNLIDEMMFLYFKEDY